MKQPKRFRSSDSESTAGAKSPPTSHGSVTATTAVQKDPATTKGGKAMNPTDAYRKEIHNREIKRMTRADKKILFSLDTISAPRDSGGGGQEINGDKIGLGSTRLGRIAIAGGKQLL